jgi:hypothetical protein
MSYHRDEFIVSVVDDEHISYVFQSHTYLVMVCCFFLFCFLTTIKSLHFIFVSVNRFQRETKRNERQELNEPSCSRTNPSYTQDTKEDKD